MKYYRYMVLLIACMLTGITYAQTDRQFIRNGNKLFHSQNFVKAEVEYRKAVSKNPNNFQALYNLGTALLMQQKDSAATDMLQRAGKQETSKIRKAQSYHNIAEAIQAYKEALRNNPADSETRYNLALCKKLLKNKPQDKKQQNKKDKNKKEDNKDKRQKQKKQNKEEQQDTKDRMSKENAEQLLKAAIQEEKVTQQRISKAIQQSGNRKLQKNW